MEKKRKIENYFYDYIFDEENKIQGFYSDIIIISVV